MSFKLLIQGPFLPAAIIVAALISPARAAQTGNLSRFVGKRVADVAVVVEGAPGSDTTEMARTITVRSGQVYSPVRIHDSLYALYKAGLISAARVEALPAGADGVDIRFLVKPQSRVDGILFEGNPIFSSDEMRAELSDLDLGKKLLPGAVASGVNDLQAFYASKGFYKPSIAPDVRLDPTGTHAIVVYKVSPGERAAVSRLAFSVSGEQINLGALKHSLAEGKPFSDSGIQDELDQIKRSYLQQGYLAVKVGYTVAADVEKNSVAITVSIESGPKVDVLVQGLDLTDKDKKQVFPFYTQGGLDESSLEEGRRRLQDFAQRKGYFFADVTRPAVPELSQSSATLTFRVQPGLRYSISSLSIRGQDVIPKQQLIDELKSKAAIAVPFFGFSRGLTSSDLLRRDANHIQKRLRDLGYRRAQVQALRAVSVNGSNLIVTFYSELGPRTYVGDITIRGNAVLQTSILLQRLSLKQGQPLDADAVNTNADKIAAAYNALGFANAEVSAETAELGDEDGGDRVRVIYDVDEGSRVTISRVTTQGAEHTDVSRLERDVYLFKPGDWLLKAKLQETERLLYDTGAYSSVTIHTQLAGKTQDGIEERDVIVDLAEAKRYLFIYSFGFLTRSGNPTIPALSVLHGVRGLVQLTDTNLFGKVDSGSVLLRVAQDEALGQISFTNPRPFGLAWPTVVSLFAQRLADTSFSSDRYTATIQAEKRLTPTSILYFIYNFEHIRVFGLKLASIDEIQRDLQPVRLGTIGPSYLRDTRDNAFDPSVGTLTTAAFSLASVALGGNEQFSKLLVQHDRYYHVPRIPSIIYSVSGKLGMAAPFGGKSTLPISERFFAGGANDLRGFGFERAGPLDPVTGNPLGGNALVVVNNELRFPIWQFLGGAVFSDTGNVFSRVGDISFSGLSETVGFGLRVKTPIGPLRFDLGFLVANRPPGQRNYHFATSFGQTF